MKHTKSLLCFLLLSGFSRIILAQNTIPTTGGNASGTGGTADIIKLKIENYEVQNLRYQLYDINGNRN